MVQTDVQEGGPESHTEGGRGQAGLNHPSPLTPASQAGPQSSSPKSHHAPRFQPHREHDYTLSLTFNSQPPLPPPPPSLAPSQLAWQVVTLQGQAPDHASGKQRNERN